MAFAAEYSSQLLDLTFNSKPLITALSQIAGEHLAEAQTVVDLILHRLQLVRIPPFGNPDVQRP